MIYDKRVTPAEALLHFSLILIMLLLLLALLINNIIDSCVMQ